MRKHLLLLLVCFCLPFYISAQSLPESRRTSFYTYIFRLTDTEAKKIYQKDLYIADQTYFHTVSDSFPTGTPYEKTLPFGHYLITHADGGELIYKLKSVNNVKLQLLKNKVDLSILATDSSGKTVSDAHIYIRNKKISYNPKSGAYIMPRTSRDGLLTVDYQGFISYYPVDTENKQSLIRKVKNRIIYTRPIYWIWKPFKDLVSSIKYQEPAGWIRSIATIIDPDNYMDYNAKYRGYMAFNKPVYQPGDTVKLKAFIVTRQGKPISHNLFVRLNTPSGKKTLTTLQPYRKGGYAYEFILKDTLQLQLDRHYDISLEKKKYKQLMYGSFKVEAYELKSNTFHIRSDKPKHYTGTAATLYAQGKDENELNVPDATVQLIVTPAQIKKGMGKYLFVKDTLWQNQQALDPIGETKIILPDSIFPPVSVDYTVHAVFLNTNNEWHTQTLDLQYEYSRNEIRLALDTNTILVEYLTSGKSNPVKAYLTTWQREIEKPVIRTIQLPFKEVLNPFVYQYACTVDSISQVLNLSEENALLQCYSQRTNDSVSIWVDNPRKLPLFYTIYRKNHVLDRGSGKALNFAAKVTTPGNYFISLQYVWNGNIQAEEYQVPFQKNGLNIQINQPLVISPGQKANIDITVTDSKGAPAAAVDLTAYAITKKFKEAYPPQVPYLGKTYRGRKSLNAFNLNQKLSQHPDIERPLNLDFWNPEMGLDSIAYYQFLYPATGMFTQYFYMADSLAQFAPYVVEHGKVLHSYLIYLDGKPVYYKDADVEQRYSFRASSGYHTVKIRTHQQIISIDSVFIKPQSKLVLSIDAGIVQQRVKVEKVKMEYSPQEQQLLNRYVMHMRENPVYKGAYLKQGDFIQPIHSKQPNRYAYNHKSSLITGLYMPSGMQFVPKDAAATYFTFEPLYTYEFEEQLLKMRSINPQNFYTYPFKHDVTKLYPDFKQQPYQAKEIDSLWAWQKEEESVSIHKYPNAKATTYGHGKLVIHQMQLPDSAEKRIKQILLFRQDEPNFLQIYPGHTLTFHQLKPGKYKVVLLLYFNYFIETGFFSIQHNGSNLITLTNEKIQRPNDFSRKAAEMIQKEAYTLNQEKKDLQQVKESYYNTYNLSPTGDFTHLVSGQVIEENGQAIPGVNVIVKGSKTGTVTDANGQYHLYVPLNGVLVFAYIGYMTEEILIGSKSLIDATLQADVQSLSEVVVIGYGEQRRSSITGSVSTLTLSGLPSGVRVRGTATVLVANNPPLIILDGVPFQGKQSDIDPKQITSIEVLKSEAATALYGSRAINGVLLISTGKKSNTGITLLQTNGESASQANSLRHNFSDYAYWQPTLTTNKAGKASFAVTFPDDMTSWRTIVMAMDGKKRSGSAEASVKAFKSVVSNLYVPRFLVAGDTALVIGKTTNYTADTLALSTSFKINDNETNTRSAKIIHTLVDSLQIKAATTDSVKISYASTRSDGFADGEMRYIPVFQKGLQETKGVFLNLDSDTTLTLNFDPALGKVKLFVQGDLLQVLLDEMEHIKKYEYLCNEQAASKLIALLLEKKVRTTIGEKFTDEHAIQRLISKLEAAQRNEGTWGWWPDSSPVIWISLHVAEALVMAEKSGYKVAYNKMALQDNLIFEMENQQAGDKLRCLRLLKLMNTKVDFRQYAETLLKDTTLSLQQQLQLIEIQQQIGMPYLLDSLNWYKQNTLLGGMYVGKESYHITDNAIINTVTAYRILKAKGGHETDLQRMRRYFMEKKNGGYWRNTYESALILSTILPDLITDGKLQPTALSLQGPLQASITTFPFQAEFSPETPLRIKKENKGPLYLTAYQQYWNTDPIKTEKDFVIRSYFKDRKSGQVHLEAGKPVKLIVEVEVKQEANYVLLEVPIPAGCSYGDKRSRYENEAYREYYIHKTSIFCQKLKKGKYEFAINLLPRYNGVYTLNPAKAGLMYFPVFYGNNEIKSLKID